MRNANKNYEHCKYIAEKLEAYTSGDCYVCPHCGEIHEMTEYEKTEHTNENDTLCYFCPACDEEIEENELEAASVYDFFDSNICDIEYRIGSDKAFRSVCIMVACGGPNIYIDTATKRVELYWWTEHADYPLLSDTCEQINCYFEELFNC